MLTVILIMPQPLRDWDICSHFHIDGLQPTTRGIYIFTLCECWLPNGRQLI